MPWLGLLTMGSGFPHIEPTVKTKLIHFNFHNIYYANGAAAWIWTGTLIRLRFGF